VRIAIAITRAASVDETWTTVHLARAALARGDTVRFIEPWDFEVDARGRLIARAHAFDAPTSADHLADALSRRRAARRYVDLERIDLMLVRAAPLDAAVLAFAEIVKERGVPVINDPAGMLRVSHKAWLASLKDVRTPPAVVTRSRASCHVFFGTMRDGVVVKPARGSGGRAVSLVASRDAEGLDVAFELARDAGDGYVVVQQYLPEAEVGEKRLVWLDGAVIGGYLRRRAPGEFRHNLKRGGLAEPTEITAPDRTVVEQVSPHLLQAGIRLAGLDVIGGNLIEVNALNPGGAFHADRLSGSRLAEVILERLTLPLQEHRTPWAVPAP
jgi:glutathione synthase